LHNGSLIDWGDFMGGFDGTGPLGQGPFTGGGRGFCVMTVDNFNRPIRGFAGLQKYPVNISYPNLQASNNFMNPLYSYYPYQLNPTGYEVSLGSYFRGRRATGVRGRGRRF